MTDIATDPRGARAATHGLLLQAATARPLARPRRGSAGDPTCQAGQRAATGNGPR